MWTKLCRATLSSRVFNVTEGLYFPKTSLTSNQFNYHRLSSSSQILQDRYLTMPLKSSMPISQKLCAKSLSGHVKNTSVLPDNITNILGKTRTPRRRNKSQRQSENSYPVVAYSTAEEYNLEGLTGAITKQELYSVVEDEGVFKVQESDHQGGDVIHIKARYTIDHEPREVFFFREGTAVFWNVSDLEISNFLRFITPFEVNRYHERLILSERELMSYIHCDSKKTVLRNDIIELASPADCSLEKYSFSNAIALSVKLGIWEASLEKFIASIEFISEDLKDGRKIEMTREEILKKQGELFALRHLINLSSDLLDTPDFYWDNEDLEKLYLQTVNYFCIGRRTRVMNEKISHCAGLVELVAAHLSDKHHVRLEWMIIVLIMVEVGFEFLHYIGPR